MARARTISAVLVMLAVPGWLEGQAAAIQGRVHDDVTGLPVPGALVRVVGTSYQARTDDEGAYRFDAIRAGRVTLRVEADRYTTLTEDTHVDPDTRVILQLSLTPTAVLLEQLTARATAGGLPAAGSIRRVVGKEDLSRPGNPAEMLTARVPGARILFTSGAVGTATQILLRGVKSLNLPGEPLYYIDGVPVAPPQPGTRTRPGEPSILDQIDPADIERIEVLSGPAASAAFGLGSNNGVILIYTKR